MIQIKSTTVTSCDLPCSYEGLLHVAAKTKTLRKRRCQTVWNIRPYKMESQVSRIMCIILQALEAVTDISVLVHTCTCFTLGMPEKCIEFAKMLR